MSLTCYFCDQPTAFVYYPANAKHRYICCKDCFEAGKNVTRCYICPNPLTDPKYTFYYKDQFFTFCNKCFYKEDLKQLMDLFDLVERMANR